MTDRETARATASEPTLQLSGVLQRKCDCGHHTVAGGGCSECEKKKGMLQRRTSSSEAIREVPPIVHDVLRSPGQPLDESMRAFMEPRFSHDFSRVRVHTDARAAESAQAVNALAYTVGTHVVFQPAHYETATSDGRKLIAHELAHVVQQHDAPGELAFGSRVSQPVDAAETEADRMAEAVVNAPSLLGTVKPTKRTQPFGDGTPTASPVPAPAMLFRFPMPWPFNGYVINNCAQPVSVWSDSRGLYSIMPHSTSARFTEDVDHIQDGSGRWYKIGPKTVTVDANCNVHGAECAVSTYSLPCPGSAASVRAPSGPSLTGGGAYRLR